MVKTQQADDPREEVIGLEAGVETERTSGVDRTETDGGCKECVETRGRDREG